MVLLGQGGSIPLCNVFSETYPGAELLLMGVEEPLALIHAPNESVDPGEIARVATAEARFLQESDHGAAPSSSSSTAASFLDCSMCSWTTSVLRQTMLAMT